MEIISVWEITTVSIFIFLACVLIPCIAKIIPDSLFFSTYFAMLFIVIFGFFHIMLIREAGMVKEMEKENLCKLDLVQFDNFLFSKKLYICNFEKINKQST
ncbi:TPA: hypothetical protein U5E43_004025 [Yersinia enterocolitica]|nr:hypothetical protein [Yersinia enterocolitica]HEN3647867.1 hypothetical protein [Yersinia enterocolitica]